MRGWGRLAVTARPTMRDIARVAGVPVSAVPLVLQNRPGVSPSRRARIQDAVRMDRDEYSAPHNDQLVTVLSQEGLAWTRWSTNWANRAISSKVWGSPGGTFWATV